MHFKAVFLLVLGLGHRVKVRFLAQLGNGFLVDLKVAQRSLVGIAFA